MKKAVLLICFLWIIIINAISTSDSTATPQAPSPNNGTKTAKPLTTTIPTTTLPSIAPSANNGTKATESSISTSKSTAKSSTTTTTTTLPSTAPSPTTATSPPTRTQTSLPTTTTAASPITSTSSSTSSLPTTPTAQTAQTTAGNKNTTIDTQNTSATSSVASAGPSASTSSVAISAATPSVAISASTPSVASAASATPSKKVKQPTTVAVENLSTAENKISKNINSSTETATKIVSTKGHITSTGSTSKDSQTSGESYDRELAIIFGVMLGLMILAVIIYAIHRYRVRKDKQMFLKGGGDIAINMSKF